MGFTFKYWVLKLAVLKRIAVLKTICSIFFRSVYRVKVYRLSCAFGGVQAVVCIWWYGVFKN